MESKFKKKDKTKICFIYMFLFSSALLKIHRKGFHFLDQFNILSASDGESDQEIASIRQKFTFFKHSYKIYSIYGEYKMKGLDIFDHAFTLTIRMDKQLLL